MDATGQGAAVAVDIALLRNCCSFCCDLTSPMGDRSSNSNSIIALLLLEAVGNIGTLGCDSGMDRALINRAAGWRGGDRSVAAAIFQGLLELWG